MGPNPNAIEGIWITGRFESFRNLDPGSRIEPCVYMLLGDSGVYVGKGSKGVEPRCKSHLDRRVLKRGDDVMYFYGRENPLSNNELLSIEATLIHFANRDTPLQMRNHERRRQPQIVYRDRSPESLANYVEEIIELAVYLGLPINYHGPILQTVSLPLLETPGGAPQFVYTADRYTSWDTVVIPVTEDYFMTYAMGMHCWPSIALADRFKHGLRFVAFFRREVKAITHFAEANCVIEHSKQRLLIGWHGEPFAIRPVPRTESCVARLSPQRYGLLKDIVGARSFDSIPWRKPTRS